MQELTAIHPAEQAERQWRDWLVLAPEAGAKIAADIPFVEVLKRVWEGSDYVAQSCLRSPELLSALVTSGDLRREYVAGEVGQRLVAQFEGVVDEPGLHAALRCFRRYEMVRIIWRDLARWAPIGESLEDLSALADACVEQALDRLYQWALEKQGVPRDEAGVQQRLVVIGMGKLGARELNLSSDIDLIFSFPRNGEVKGGRYLSNEQFFTRLCQQLVKALNTQTVDGFVFRVDTRLRPFGESGPLAISFDAMEEYYQSQAREWERYAMIKARVVAGDREAGVELTALLRPFVYRRYLDFGAIDSLRDMKRLISRELHKKGMDANIKLGRGGIREIEFIGQAFQLIRGGREPVLQIRPILQVLKRLEEKELLPEYVVRELTDAYGYLRLVENRLQAWQDRQTHQLPEDETGRLRLARSMGREDWDGFVAELEHHRQRVQGHFDKVFVAPQADEEAEESSLFELWRGGLEDEQAEQVLELAGFGDPAEVLRWLNQFRNSYTYRGLGERGGQRLDQLMPLVLEAIAGCDEPGVTLERVLKLLEAITRRTSYIALLMESPIALSQLVRLSSVSPWIAGQLTRHPLLLDELLDPRRLYSPLHREELKAELETLASGIDEEDLEQQMERLRQFAQSNMLRVAAADITGVIPLMVVSDYLTEIAEAITGRVLERAWAHFVRRHGRPTGVLGSEKGFAVIAYGKLGGVELGYGSDLDLVFLHGSRGANAMTNGERPVPNDLFYARLGQRMIHMFTTRTPSGLLYEVDMRLRPSGNSGMLVTPLETFESYQKEDAWTWEHQALLRARPIAGDPELLTEFRRIRREVLSRERDAGKLRSDVREMREKMRDSLDRSISGQFDLKQGRGGIADIEFMVQYAVLRWAHHYPDLLNWTDNIRLLETLASHEILEGDAAQLLADAYRTFRAIYHRDALREQPGLMPESELAEQRGMVREIWHSMMEAGS